MRANTNIKLKTRSVLTLSDFRGADFSSSPLTVKSNRASDMQNLINEYGVNHKRPGWDEQFRISNKKINGIFSFKVSGVEALIIHAGTRFYRAYNGTNGWSCLDITSSSTYVDASVNTALIKDTKSQGFIYNGRLYIVGCGDFLVYGSWDDGDTYELRRVYDNEDTYIPTTTISIDRDGVVDEVRSTLDDVNFLSSRRKNQLLGHTEAATWTLDSGKIDSNTIVEITLDTFRSEAGQNVPVTYLIRNSSTDLTTLKVIEQDGEEVTSYSVGSINFTEGKISFTVSTEPQIGGRDNIFVEFSCANSDYTERITKCKFGIMFGVGGNTDRLFLSGNDDYPNIDFYSEQDDFTYFGDQNTASMGSDASKVMGYARLSDSTLAIFKEQNYQDPTIFYRTGKYNYEYDSNGNISKMTAVFPTTAGTLGEGIVSSYASANFFGDNLILSANGVFGIVLGDNVATNERYAKERSRTINEKLRRLNLSDAVAIAYKGRYYLAVDNQIFVADSRYKFSQKDGDGSFNYEWWYWNNCPVRCFLNRNNELWFGTKDGLVCRFDDEYSDRTHQKTNAGELLIDYVNNAVSHSNAMQVDIAVNDVIKFNVTSRHLYADWVLGTYTVSNGRIYPDDVEEINNIVVGTELYADSVGTSGLAVNTKYIVTDVDRGEGFFGLMTENGTTVNIASGGFRLCRDLSGKDLYISEVETNRFRLKEYEQAETLTLVRYNNEAMTNPIASVTHYDNVVAKWFTPVTDLGTNIQSKTLLSLSISTEPNSKGKIDFGYETRQADRIASVKGINIFALDNIDFENFSFETDFANSYTRKVQERNFNFIIFRFVSDNKYDCAVNNISITYKVNSMNRGVR